MGRSFGYLDPQGLESLGTSSQVLATLPTRSLPFQKLVEAFVPVPCMHCGGRKDFQSISRICTNILCIHISVHICIYIYAHTYLSMCMHKYVYVYMYTYIHSYSITCLQDEFMLPTYLFESAAALSFPTRAK